MGMGPIVWTCLALTVHNGPVQEYYVNFRALKIPVRIDERRRDQIHGLNLLVSHDQGQSWELSDSKQAAEKEFQFHAPKDGCYWFIVQQVDHDGRTNPDNPNRVKPSMAVMVDTVAPQVKVTAERLGSGEIRARWTVAEQYPDAASLRLEYHTRAMPEGQWTPLGAPPSLEGNHSFNPGRDGQTGEVRVRVRVKDQAQNVGVDEFVLAATGVAVAEAPAEAAQKSAFNVIPTAQAEPSRQANLLTSQSAPPRPLRPDPMAMGSAANPAFPSGPRRNEGIPEPLAASDRLAAPTTPAAANVQIVKTREVRLNFTVAKVGPSGLGNADVYVTLDKGASWKKVPAELPINLPQGADIHGADPVAGSVSVQLPAEATTYGFIVAVKSKAGLAPPPPKPGDAPEIFVELDTTAPKANLFRPQPDLSQPDTLILGWEAKDRNLSDNPILLEWAEQNNGPWSAIGSGPLPNSGQYPWRLPPQMPSRVYLRLTVRDVAGNEARAQTDKPVLVDLSVPQTKITGVAPNAR